jgi:ABC-type multidrug transport system ATPase subunit
MGDIGDSGDIAGSACSSRSPAMLSIRNLSKTYPNGVRALCDVSLDVPTGMFGLLGPNGAGKSTLMRTLATLQEADSGSVTFDGIDVLREKPAVRRLLGYLPQEFGVYPKISAEAMLEHFAVLKGLSNAGERRAVVRALLQRTNLWEVRHRRLGTFSGGMRQRFGIAQALLGDPRLVIVDEPTAGLDPEERNRFLNLLAEIGENVVVILSTHIVEDVSDLCSRTAIIAQGEVRLSGEPRQIIASLAGRIWRRLVGKAELADYQGRLEVLSTRLVGGHTEIHVFSPERPDDGFLPVEPDLEDAYFHALRQAGQTAVAA